jgi:hypothetical protein
VTGRETGLAPKPCGPRKDSGFVLQMRQDHATVWNLSVPPRSVFKRLVPRMALLEGSGTFKRWDLVGGF